VRRNLSLYPDAQRHWSDRLPHLISNKDLPGLIEQKKFKSNPIKKMGTSLDQIKEGLDYLRDGKVSSIELPRRRSPGSARQQLHTS
jgi:hypothetical protein